MPILRLAPLFAAIALVGACGSTAAPPGVAPGSTGPSDPTASLGDIEVDHVSVVVPDAASAGDVPPSQQGSSPAITDVATATAAAKRGFYEAAERFLRGQSAPSARLALARVELETGRYAEAGASAEAAARDASLRVDAETVRGEAAMRRGQLDDAERILRAVASEPTAFRANLLLGRLLVQRGQTADGHAAFHRLIRAYNDESIRAGDADGLAYVAMAAWGLGSFQDANDAFQESTRADPQRVETQVEWARMFLEKYDAGQAEECLRAAFVINPSSAEAHAVMARIRIEQTFDFAAATAYSERALEIAPALVMAHVTLAGMDLRDMDFAAADAHLASALGVNPNDLEALSVQAAGRFLADDTAGFATAKREVLGRNPRFSRMYTIIAEFADWEHRYPEIVQMARDAIAMEPNDAFAHATLGLNLLRMGDETAGLEALRAAWQRDRFNVHVYNTLNLYDDVIPAQYTTFDHPPFVFRMHNDERPMLERYVPDMLVRAYGDMRRRYGMAPEGPVRIELFSDVQHFSVRTTGLPNLGVQGVCFGKVVTAVSPRGGEFNWGQITWHELAHVFHIQLSRNRVPRWFTEGLAEYETIVARPEWRREEDHRLYTALRDSRLPPLRLMNRAFTHARSAEEMMTAYYASSQIVAYIVERYGFEKMPAMLRLWGAGRDAPDVFREALGVSIDEVDREFRSHTLRRLAARADDFSVSFTAYDDFDTRRRAAAAAPRDAAAHAALAAAHLFRGEADEAKAAAERAIVIQTHEPLARTVLARLALGSSPPEAEQHMRAIIAGGRDGYEVRLMLARAAMARRDRATMQSELEAAGRIDADRAEAWQGLLAIATEGNDDALKLRALERLASVDQHDRATWIALLEALRARGQWDELLERGESALFLAPHSEVVHHLLGEAYAHANRHDDALREHDSALIAAPELAAAHLGRARALAALGRRPQARVAAQRAAELDPGLAPQAAEVR